VVTRYRKTFMGVLIPLRLIPDPRCKEKYLDHKWNLIKGGKKHPGNTKKKFGWTTCLHTRKKRKTKGRSHTRKVWGGVRIWKKRGRKQDVTCDYGIRGES